MKINPKAPWYFFDQSLILGCHDCVHCRGRLGHDSEMVYKCFHHKVRLAKNITIARSIGLRPSWCPLLKRDNK